MSYLEEQFPSLPQRNDKDEANLLESEIELLNKEISARFGEGYHVGTINGLQYILDKDGSNDIGDGWNRIYLDKKTNEIRGFFNGMDSLIKRAPEKIKEKSHKRIAA